VIRPLDLLIRALLVSALPTVVWAAYEAPPEAAALRIGVAPFQVVSPPDVDVPDLADSLAEGLQAQGLERIVGPDALGAPRIAEPAPGLVRSLAARAGVDALLVGRTTRLGNRLSVDVRLRSGLSGAVAGTYVAEVSASEPLAPALDRLVEQVVVGALALAGAEARGGPVAPGVLGGVVPAQPAIVAAPSEGAPFGFGNLAGTPISIRSDELEATDSDGVRTLIFRQNVEVRQADLFLGARYLEARYRDGSKQPDRLVARGDVLIRQGEREGRCAEAFYDHPGQRIVCRGDAELRDGADRVSGESIAFDLVRQRVSVEGGADLLLHPTPRKDETAPGKRERQVGLESDEPVAIRAERLDAEPRSGATCASSCSRETSWWSSPTSSCAPHASRRAIRSERGDPIASRRRAMSRSPRESGRRAASGPSTPSPRAASNARAMPRCGTAVRESKATSSPWTWMRRRST
jgi:lipopolysaccharide export system protein LptA